MPAAMARIAIIKGKPEKLNLSIEISPVRMSQMANNRKPRFFVIFMVVLLSKLNVWRAMGRVTRVSRKERG